MARCLRVPYRKLFMLVVLLYGLLLGALLFAWKSYGTVPLRDFLIDGHAVVKVGNLVQKVRVAVQSGIINIAQPEVQRECDIKHKVSFMNRTIIINQDPVCGWLKAARIESQGQFVNFGSLFARLHNVIIDPSLGVGRKGGESISSVLNQREEEEYLNLKKGYFSLNCDTPPGLGFGGRDHLLNWNNVVSCKKDRTETKRVKGMTLAVMRYEYVNLYHTMTDFYNAFLMMLVFDQHPDNMTVLWVDAHPQGGLDETWNVLFGETKRAGLLEAPTQFDDMVWGIMGYNSPLNFHYTPFVPYLGLFREFFLSRHKVKTSKQLNCHKLNVMFIWRRDYVAHPRNPKGLLKRKITNEDEIIANLNTILPGHKVTGVQLDMLPMKQQLELISNTDILLGMHGAGMSHTLFLPKHAGVLEFYPIYWSQANQHFRAMASWRGLPYQTWQNYDGPHEKENYFTYIPPKTVNQMLLEVKGQICPPSSR
ncbi:beta-1,2-xylosyltransferase RCN11-like [Haliotis rufescens]|uniref:beta-1,2-xylosyltransferase RCN11-like n=1 Tax=Haliotis rufescens TaxID=6454 RepID=UPI00201ED672|nr:beta-1,2-xylosyltransferase RCN11-like [Haliotis rufescens]